MGFILVRTSDEDGIDPEVLEWLNQATNILQNSDELRWEYDAPYIDDLAKQGKEIIERYQNGNF